MLLILALAAALCTPPQAPVTGDFDRDGKPDTASLVTLKDGRLQIVIRRSDKARTLVVLETYPASARPNIYLAKARPGTFPTWCGKGGGQQGDPPCRRTSVTLGKDVLAYGIEEATGTVALWTGRRFETVLMSD